MSGGIAMLVVAGFVILLSFSYLLGYRHGALKGREIGRGNGQERTS